MEARDRWLLYPLLTALLCQVTLSLGYIGQEPKGFKGANNAGLGGGPFSKGMRGKNDAVQRRLLRMQGHEVIPPVISNVLPNGEPTCEELRAMWRYYKRQSRAELTNEIPQFGTPLFWDFMPQQHPSLSSFGLRGRSKPMRLKGPRQTVYGTVMIRPPEENRRRRPIEDVIRMFGMNPAASSSKNAEPIVHYTSPAEPTKETSLQKIKGILREEKNKENSGSTGTPTDDNKEYGKVMWSPPTGQDGRVANKPKELMTAFEKIRFGHADEILDDENRPSLDVMKRRTLPLPMMMRDRSPWGNSRPSKQSDSHVDSSWPAPDDTSNKMNETAKSTQPESSSVPNSVPSHPSRAIMLKPRMAVDSSPTCAEVEGQSCRWNADCSCVGFGLYRCHEERCQVLFFSDAGTTSEEMNENGGVWHSEPLETSQLGIWGTGGDVIQDPNDV